MSSFVNICCKLDPKSDNKLNKIVLNDMKTKVKNLSQMVSNQFNLTEEEFDLMCFGRVLSPESTLDSYEITNGTTVWVINKTNLLRPKEKTKPEVNKDITQSDVQNMVIALKTALMDSAFRQFLDKLSEPEFKENFFDSTPGLREDPTAFAILQDLDLLSILTEPTNIHKVLERHPSLLDASLSLSAQFHEESVKKEGPSSSGLLSRSSSINNYSLDAMSDDEDMDESEPSTGSTASSEAARIIADQMIRAFSNRTGSASNQTTSSPIITQDMLRQALQQSSSDMSQPSTSTAPVTPTATTPPVSTPSTSLGRGPSVSERMNLWAKQLQQMRDMGIDDQIVAIQALEATNGDVQAAVNIIYGDQN